MVRRQEKYIKTYYYENCTFKYLNCNREQFMQHPCLCYTVVVEAVHLLTSAQARKI